MSRGGALVIGIGAAILAVVVVIWGRVQAVNLTEGQALLELWPAWLLAATLAVIAVWLLRGAPLMPLRSNIGRIRAGLKGAAGRGVERAAGFVADLAQQLAPVDTGELRQSIQVEPGESETQRAVTAGRGLPDIRAAAQEYGTNTQPAQPYMTPAARAIKPEAEVASELRDLYRSNGL